MLKRAGRYEVADQAKIDLNRERELTEWCKTFATTPDKLKQAIQAVGITPRKVRAYLREH